MKFIRPGTDNENPFPIDLDDILQSTPPWKLIKRNTRNVIAKNEQLNIFYKDFSPTKDPIGWLKRLVGMTPAKRSLKGSKLLLAHNLLAPRVLATGSIRNNDYIIMENLTGPQLHNTVRSFLTHPSGSRLAWKRKLFRTLGAAIGHMHASGIVHGDLRPNNIILHTEGTVLKIGLIDNERTRKPVPWRANREQRKNLIQIMMLNSDDATTTDRLRFFSGYFSAFPHSAQQKRKLVLSVFSGVRERFERGSSPLGTIIDDTWWTYLSNATDFQPCNSRLNASPLLPKAAIRQ